ncbi:30S ribosomal protein S3 [Patescibacteria group bacterium]|nr:30S ribosomal protein S3 [Patescibacteria group bacterium]MCL5733492.1 30S ribosomal protein S3 [Patescibacteria group bacterium]
MGQKINPFSYRLGINKNWASRWFVKSGYIKFLEEDELIRNVIEKKINQAGIIAVEIERTGENCRVYIKVARAGMVIGRGGKGVEDLTKDIERAIKKLRVKNPRKKNAKEPFSLSVNVEELKRGDVSAKYTAQQIAWDLEKRMGFKGVIKKQLERIMQNKDIRGAKILLSGRLDGNEIARREWLRKGELPLQKLRANIDYGQATAHCSYGTVGIKVWLYKGDILEK